MAQYRQLCRWQTKAKLPHQKSETFFRNLSLVAEHTWGMDEKIWLADYDRYCHKDFLNLRKTRKAQLFEKSWQEQRDYIGKAIKSLPNDKLIKEATGAIKQLQPHPSQTTEFRAIDVESPIITDNYELRLNPDTGAINRLKSRTSGQTWTSTRHNIGEFMFQTFSREDYNRFISQYLRNTPDWALKDFSKQGLPGCVESTQWYPESCKMYQKVDSFGQTLLCKLRMPKRAVLEYGCPADIETIYTFPKDGKKINISFQWFNKRASRLPQAAWLSINPKPIVNSYWILDKLGQLVDSRDIVKNAGRKLHAVTENVIYRTDQTDNIKITTFDAPLVAIGEPSLLRFDNKETKNNSGVHFNLYNNVFCTNFPMWFDEDAQFRFTLNFETKPIIK